MESTPEILKLVNDIVVYVSTTFVVNKNKELFESMELFQETVWKEVILVLN